MKLKCLMLLAALGATLARAETNDVIQIWPGIAPGAEPWSQQKITDESLVRPTLTLFLPSQDRDATMAGPARSLAARPWLHRQMSPIPTVRFAH